MEESRRRAAAKEPVPEKKAAGRAEKRAPEPAKADEAPAKGAAAKKKEAVPLTVSPCADQTISEIISGRYNPVSMNHGKVVYKKVQKSGAIDVMIYYWDDRDGPELCGWWFGPNVGGDQVWAYHPSRTAATPPASEWNVPHDGQIDPTFSVSVCRDGAAAPPAAKPRAAEAPRREPTPEPPAKEPLRGEGRGRRGEPAEASPPKKGRKGSEEPREGKEGGKADTHAYFVNAYKRRWEERAKAEEQKKKDDEDKTRQEEDRRKREVEDRRRAEEDKKIELQKKMEQIRKQEEEERRQMEDLKRKADDQRKKREEEKRRQREEAEREEAERRKEAEREKERERERAREDKERERRDEEARRAREKASRSEREEASRGGREERRDAGRDRDEGRRGGRDERRRESPPARRASPEHKEARRRSRSGEDRRGDEKRHDKRDDKDAERQKRDEARREAERKAKEEEMIKRDKELQQRRDERRKREEEERKKADEDRRRDREKEDVRRRDEDRDKEKLKAEEDAKRSKEEDSKKSEETKALKQQKATLGVLRVLQKLSNATPDNFESLNTELEQVMKTELPDTGPQQDILKAEAKRVCEYAKKYVEQVREQQRKVEEAEAAEKAKIATTEKAARAVIEKLNDLIKVAEEASEGAHYTCAPIAGEHTLEPPTVIRLAMSVEQAGRLAMVACSNCADFLMKNKQVIDEAESIRAETTSALVSLQPRIQTATKQATEAMQRAASEKDNVSRKFAAQRHVDKAKAKRESYDKDKDGMLNRQEIAALAMGEYKFKMPEENLDRICGQLIKPGRRGVRLEDFQQLKTAIGIARMEAKNAKQRDVRLQREKIEREKADKRKAIVDAKMETLKPSVEALMAKLEELGPQVQASESAAQELTQAAGSLTTQDLKNKSEAVTVNAGPARKSLEEIKIGTAKLQKEVEGMAELGDILRNELHALTSRGDMFDMRLKTVEGIASNGRQLALHKEFAEREALRMEVAARLRVCIEAQGGKPDDLFDQIAPNAKMDLADIVEYLGKNQCEIEQEKLEIVFGVKAAAPADDKKDGDKKKDEKDGAAKKGALIAKEDFLRVIRIFYKTIKEIVLSDNLLIEQSRQIRRLEVGEVMEVYQGPMLDPSVGVYRVHGKVLKDGIVGWVTVAGNQGVTFLMPGGNIFQVVRPVALTEDLKDTEGTNVIKQLKEGQVLEVLEWARTSRSALGVTRIKAKLQGEDAAIGWATITDNEGSAFLEAN